MLAMLLSRDEEKPDDGFLSAIQITLIDKTLLYYNLDSIYFPFTS